ncbi:hypothetical protein [Parasitella parasitica]|uniref:Uncharacterized protein n=1 Tax=Parasitella parasitica TaxID=35722 RepID=A0A0B7NMW5_9FUNG|nr:hypothetical protein [Parasitella parasitica]
MSNSNKKIPYYSDEPSQSPAKSILQKSHDYEEHETPEHKYGALTMKRNYLPENLRAAHEEPDEFALDGQDDELPKTPKKTGIVFPNEPDEWKAIDEKERKIKEDAVQLLPPKIYGQLVPDSHAPVAADNLMLLLANESTIVQGVDPGIVTTAGYWAISDDKIVPLPMDAHVEFGLPANTVITAVMSNQDRNKREKSGMQKKQLQRTAAKRRIREKLFYQRKVAQDKAKTRHENASFITFTGNWSGSGKYVKGHSRSSTRPHYTQLAACEKDFVLSVDEYKSTITCSSCFQRTTKQTQIRDGKVKSIPGVVVCFDPRCPRRISTSATTSNRDRNEATKIAMIGFSSLVSEDGLPLPAFRRTQSNKCLP